MFTAPVTPQSRSLAVGRSQVGFDDTGGDGPVILAIPGMGDLRSQYRHLRPALVQAGYRVVTMDVRGFGETSAQWDDYSARAVGRDALALLDHLGVGAAIILGNSFAAGSAVWAAREAPERVSGIALFGPILSDLKVSVVARLALGVGFAGPWRRWFWTAYWDSLFTKRKPSDHAEARAALTRNLREPGRMEALRAMIHLSKADTAAILPKNRVPTLIVMGTRDPDFPDPVAEATELARLMSANTLLVEGAGHYPQTEVPDEVVPRLLSFFEGLGRV